jgi:hypothetical protein
MVGQTLGGVPNSNSPALRAVVDAYGAEQGIDLTPDFAPESGRSGC